MLIVYRTDVTCNIPPQDVSSLNQLKMHLDTFPRQYKADKLTKAKLNEAVGLDGILSKLFKLLPDVFVPHWLP